MEILVSVPVVPRGHEFLGRDDGDRRLGVRPGGRRGEAFHFAVLRELRRGPRRGGACRSNESDGDETSGWTIHDVPPVVWWLYIQPRQPMDAASPEGLRGCGGVTSS